MTNRFEIYTQIAIEDVGDVRRFVEKLHRRVLADEDTCSRVALVAHELLENAVKFSSDGTALLRVEVEAGALCITTRNRARPGDIDALERATRELDSASDPMIHYVELMQRSPQHRGGLGLGRIAAEGEMVIAFRIDGDLVEVNAKASV